MNWFFFSFGFFYARKKIHKKFVFIKILLAFFFLMDFNLPQVPLVPPDLRREEMMAQIANSMQAMHELFGAVSKRIEQKLESCTNRTKILQQRISITQAKVDKLKTDHKKRATVVFAPAKY